MLKMISHSLISLTSFQCSLLSTLILLTMSDLLSFSSITCSTILLHYMHSLFLHFTFTLAISF